MVRLRYSRYTDEKPRCLSEENSMETYVYGDIVSLYVLCYKIISYHRIQYTSYIINNYNSDGGSIAYGNADDSGDHKMFCQAIRRCIIYTLIYIKFSFHLP